MNAFLWLRTGLFALVLITAGCSKSTESTAVAQAESDSNAGEPTNVKQETKPSTKPGSAKKPSEAARNAAAAEPVQRVFRPSVPVPRHDDRLLTARGIHRYESKHLILYTDIDPERARPLPRLMDEAYEAWEDYFGPLPPDREGNDFQMIGYIMADRELFRETGLMTADIHISLEGVYRNQIFWMNDQPIDYYRRHLMIHEGTHCFMMAFPNPTNQFIWYVEGMAELFRAHQTDALGHTQFRLFPRDKESFAGLGWMRLIHEDVRAGGPRTIEAVLGMRPNDFQKYNAYAWSWALCAFLDGHPRYRDRFRRIGSLVTGRNDSGFELGEVFKADWRDLSEEWLVYAGNVGYGYDIERTVLDLRPGSPLSGRPAKIEVAAERGWQSTGILVERGQTYQIAAEGRCTIATVPKPWESEPQGISFRYHAGLPVGMLVATVRGTALLEQPTHTRMLEVLPIGRGKRLAPEVTGTLYFRVNDYWNELGDNDGSYQVTVTEAARE
jgi:hypothetical protein